MAATDNLGSQLLGASLSSPGVQHNYQQPEEKQETSSGSNGPGDAAKKALDSGGEEAGADVAGEAAAGAGEAAAGAAGGEAAAGGLADLAPLLLL